MAGVAFCTLLIPRSEKAPYGYGRTEYLAGFIVAATSVVVGGLFLIRSLNRMAMPEPVWFGVKSCILISVTVPVNSDWDLPTICRQEDEVACAQSLGD